MSTDEQDAIEDLSKALEQWGAVMKALKFLMVGAFGIGVWVATLEFRARTLEGDSVSGREFLHQFTVWKSQVEGTRWTIQDHTDYVQRQDERDAARYDQLRQQNTLQELRLQRLEDNQATIEKEISEKLKVTPAMVLEEVRKLRNGN
jgi:hypothetical protein